MRPRGEYDKLYTLDVILISRYHHYLQQTKPPRVGSAHPQWYNWVCQRKTMLAVNARAFAAGGWIRQKLKYRRLHARVLNSQRAWRRRALCVQDMKDGDVRRWLRSEPPVRDASSDLIMAQRALARAGQQHGDDLSCVEGRAVAILDLGLTHLQ